MKKIKKFFYFLTVKTPITVILIIAVTTASLITIAYYNYTNEYVKLQGTIEKDDTEKSYIKIQLDKKYAGNLNKDGKVIWYTSISGKRYEGSLDTASSEENGKIYTKNIRIDKNDLAKEFKNIDKSQHKEVTVEICLKKVRILDKILKEDGQ